MITKLAKIVSNIRYDISNFNIENENENKVIESNYFSAYKRKIVIRTNLKRSGSYGILFISRKVCSRKNPEDEVRHEYGHTVQLKRIGLLKYTFCIGIPSLFLWGTGRYYDRPWEITADIFGNVKSRKHSDEMISLGMRYLSDSKNKTVISCLRKARQKV